MRYLKKWKHFVSLSVLLGCSQVTLHLFGMVSKEITYKAQGLSLEYRLLRPQVLVVTIPWTLPTSWLVLELHRQAAHHHSDETAPCRCCIILLLHPPWLMFTHVEWHQAFWFCLFGFFLMTSPFPDVRPYGVAHIFFLFLDLLLSIWLHVRLFSNLALMKEPALL